MVTDARADYRKRSLRLLNRRVLTPYRHEKKLKNYVDSLRAADLEPIPVLASGRTELKGVAGLLLMGGTDVNPKLFGAAPDPATQIPDDERDAFELDLLDQALASDLPVFAICRGLQLLNVHSGGTLRQHLASQRHNTPRDADFAHEIEIEPGTLLSSIAAQPRWPVNSYHHQAAERVGAVLRVSARDAEDGTIEALEHTQRTFVLGVQWHPEDLAASSADQLRLFQHFAKRIHRS